MNPWTCPDVVDRLPERASGRLSSSDTAAVDAHLRTCAECAAEAALLALLRDGRPEPPATLAARIADAVRTAAPPVPVERPRRAWRVWAGSVAAALVLALGTLTRPADEPAPAGGLGAVAVDEAVWIAEDGIVAGAPVLDEIPDEDLALLLEEMGG